MKVKEQPLKAPFRMGDAEYRPLVRKGIVFPGYWVGDNGLLLSQWVPGRCPAGRIRWEIGEVVVPLIPTTIGRRKAYLGVSLRRDGRTFRASVHALVAEAFLGPCPEGEEVCHGDGNGRNNRLTNLRYGTRAANEADKDGHGTHQRGQQNPSANLTNEQAEEIRRLRAGGVKLKELAVRFGVRESTVSRIANRIRRGR